jgi:hypothetical protein
LQPLALLVGHAAKADTSALLHGRQNALLKGRAVKGLVRAQGKA